MALLPIPFLPVVLQAQLDEQVPYQGDTLLSNPMQFQEDGNGHVFMDCDWQTMVSMIRDLEERIAGEVVTDTIYGDYRTKELTGDRLYMRYECIVLRDSILSLQIAYDEVLAPRVTLDSAVILSDISAALSASFTGSGVESSGFKWAVDSLMTSPQSGIGTGATSPIADTLTALNPGKLHYFTAYAVKNGEYFYGDTLPMLTMPGITTNAAYEVMIGSGILSSTFSADSIDGQGFVWGQQRDLSDGTSVAADTTDGSTSISYELTGLASGEAHYFSAFASNASGTTFGDTLSFITRPGITTESANVLSSMTATLNGTFAADSITAQGFVWGVESDLSDGADVASDTTTGSSAFDYALSDLAEGVLHHYSAYGTNATGTTRGDTVAFLTMPGISTDTADELTAETATLNSTFSADSITAQGFVWGLQFDLSDGTSVSADTTGGSSTIEYALTGLAAQTTYYFSAFATNASGTSYGDTLSFSTTTPITDANIQTAVNLWVSDQTAATTTYGHISDWNTSAVTNMASLFQDKTTFNDDISGWDVSSVTDMQDMFKNASAFNQPIGNWNVGSVTTMMNMFRGAAAFNQDIGGWVMSNVTSTIAMFNGASAFNQDIGGWAVTNVTAMGGMFFGCNYFNKNIGNWDVSSVTDMNGMFYGASVFNQDLGSWNVSSVKNMFGMFRDATAFDQDLGNWMVGQVTMMKEMFDGASVFNQDISGWDVGSVTNMQGMFRNAAAFNQDIGNWNVSSVTNMWGMFNNASAFNQDLGNWSVGQVTTMMEMFYGASAFNQDISGWDVSSASTMFGMFRGAVAFNQDIGSWTVSNVTQTSLMFYGASAFNQNIGNWDVDNVTSMENMFNGASAFNQNIGNWDVSSVTNMNGMFNNNFLFYQNLSGWCVAQVVNEPPNFGNALGANPIWATCPGLEEFTTCGDEIGYDGYDYETVQIGDQCWFAENLRSDNYADGTTIPGFLGDSEWAATDSGARAVLDEVMLGWERYGDLGLLYNWHAVDDSKGLCPNGWHVPNDDEWTALAAGLGGNAVAGGKLKSSPDDSPAWDGTNTSGFSGLRSGYRKSDGTFSSNWAPFWSASPVSNPNFTRTLGQSSNDIFYLGTNEQFGLSVRCVQDLSMTITADEVTDGDSSSDATLSLTFTASATTTDFDEADITLTNGTLSDFNGSGTTYMATFTPTADGPCTIHVAGSTFTDALGNDNAAGDEFNWTYIAPAVFTTCGDEIGYEGYNYSTIEIGDQCWFADNLRSTNYLNGDPIPNVTNGSEWSSLTTGAQCSYDNDDSNISTYGRLYNWYAVQDFRGLCPTGWHVPSDTEWTTLTNFLGGASVAGGKMKSSSSDTPAWNGDNSSGFSALPGGWRNPNFGEFSNEGFYGGIIWWSASSSGATSAAWCHGVDWDNSEPTSRLQRTANSGHAVRCVQD